MSVNPYNLNTIETVHKTEINAALDSYDPKNPDSAQALFDQLNYLKDDLYDQGESLDQMKADAASGSATKGLFDAIGQTYSLGYQITTAQQAITQGKSASDINKILANVWGDFDKAIANISNAGDAVAIVKPIVNTDTPISGSTSLDQAKNVQQTVIKNVDATFKTYKAAYNAASPKGNINDPNLINARQTLVNALATASSYILNGTHGDPKAFGLIQKMENANKANPNVQLEGAIGKAYSLEFRITSALAQVSNAATMPDPNATGATSLAGTIGSASTDGTVLGNMAKVVSMLS